MDYTTFIKVHMKKPLNYGKHHETDHFIVILFIKVIHTFLFQFFKTFAPILHKKCTHTLTPLSLYYTATYDVFRRGKVQPTHPE